MNNKDGITLTLRTHVSWELFPMIVTININIQFKKSE